METTAIEEKLLSFIKKIAKEQQFDKFEVKITPVSSGGANYTSALYRVKVFADGRDDLYLFAKVAAWSEKMKSQTLMDPFKNETFVYTNIFQTYRLLEDRHGVPEENRLRFPKYYGTDTTYLQEMMVLEDLTSKGFKSANRFESVDWPYAAAAITELAKFHALSIAYQHENPSEFEKHLKRFPAGFLKETEASDFFFNNSILLALAAVREDNRQRLESFFKGKNLVRMYNNNFEALRRKVLMHVDFRPNNMLHKVKNDGTIEVVPVDYQTIQGGSPIVDLMYFIFTATDGLFRAKYYDKLVNHYHSELGVALARLGLDVEDKYSREDFQFELKEKQLIGLMMALILLPIITIPEDQAPAVNDSMDVTSLAVKVTNELYSQRINEIVDDFVEWGAL